MHPILKKQNWIFDMDGTLTIPIHDFNEYKKLNNLPEHRPLLEAINELPTEQVQDALDKLEKWEEELAWRSILAKDTLRMLKYLHSNGKNIGLLTRNTRRLAHITLEATNIQSFFQPEVILGRNCAQPKPSPDGIRKIMKIWDASPQDTVMLGDHQFDIDAGKSAGTATIFIGREHDSYSVADIQITSFDDLF